ncbi:hypothetical protein [Microvirga lotononidis]|uniref:Uncharacterized protein n=1 Tax=Microvirga lotononidis TaxID=864069 RepID=I4Z0Q4_9HYPH|nr:hypothetical protein [Microvirga lotononidis]EIM29796.1 hypothetical protein MicloDRAFT_00011160 [Microvirga lotononidis]WQO31113.1 hypothetical protein U0023_32925 [Microvirga lotononidis]
MSDIYWKRTSDVWGDEAGDPTDFTAIDPERPGSEPEQYIGRVMQHLHGPQKGLWFWSMICTNPGPRFPFPTNGTEARRGDAGRRVIECYRRMAGFYGVPDLKTQHSSGHG